MLPALCLHLHPNKPRRNLQVALLVILSRDRFIMAGSQAVLGAAAAARAHAEGTGLRSVAKNMRIVYIAIFASLVGSSLLGLKHTN